MGRVDPSPLGSAAAVLSGWGRAAASRGELSRPASTVALAEMVQEFAANGERLIARGLGRSYGDAAQGGGQKVLDMTGLDAVLEFDPATGVLRAEAGLSIDALLRSCVPAGWFVPVTPGTRQVTLGGAVAADVHGKNHHRDGSFGQHVRALSLCTPTGVVRLGRVEREALFWSTVGGMGLTGVVSEVEVQLTPIESAYLRVDTDRAVNLEAAMAMLAEGDDRYRYSVAWIDCLSSGSSFGRSVLTRGAHAVAGELEGKLAAKPLAYAPRAPAKIPFAPPVTPLNSLSARLLNELWYRKAPRHKEGEIQTIGTFFHPLDGVGSWNLLYGPRGFTQYQLVVPFGAEDTIRAVIETLQRRHLPSFLGVLKRFGAADPAPLSFPRPGWTLALDLPLGRPGLPEALDALDALVLEAGGRVYLAKDGRLSPVLMEAMYPRLVEWRRVATSADPDGVFSSDLATRLHLRPTERDGPR